MTGAGVTGTIDGLILAAGESRRMGSHKALLPFSGQTFLDTLIELFARHCRQVTVVLGYDAAGIREGLARGAQTSFVGNPEYRAGQLSSLQAGLRSMPEAEHILLTLVDHPAVRDATIARIVSSPALLAIPQYQGRHGHPIFFARSIAAELLALPIDASAREVIHRHREQTRFVDVDDPGILVDVDDAAAYAALLRSSAPA
ncbi:MAG TPA: hypothetical protein DEQ47_06005 [Solibacterales bacterium]|nr:hypothetical protein [Bryobacterales bacterium]